MLDDPHPQRADLQDLRQHARTWNVSQKQREKVVATVTDLLASKNRRVRIAAARTLVKLVESDRAEELARARLARATVRAAAARPADDGDARGDPAAQARACRAYRAALAAGLDPATAAHRALKAANHPEAEETSPCSS